MLRKFLLLALVLMSFGCARLPAYWQYNQKINLHRTGNEFVAEAAGIRRVVARVSSDFDFVRADESNFNYFENISRDKFVVVMERFGLFKDKFSYENVLGNNGFNYSQVVENGELGTNDEYAISLMSKNGYNILNYFHYHHDLTAGGWANFGAGYSEELQRGSPSDAYPTKEFLAAFKQRARKAFVVLPKD